MSTTARTYRPRASTVKTRTPLPQMTRYTGSEDWSALYVDGTLDSVGDHYTIDERIAHIAGVVEVDSDDFMRGGNQRRDVAPDLAAVQEYAAKREESARAAQELRERAAELLRQRRPTPVSPRATSRTVWWQRCCTR